MRLLDKDTCKEVEMLLLSADCPMNELVVKSLDELNRFFDGTLHQQFLVMYYYDRYKYKHSYPRKENLFKKIYRQLYVEEPTLYQIKREVLYKAAMIFYKNGVLK